MKEYEDAGIDRDTALATAIDDVATNLGTTKTELLNQIETTEDTILDRFDEGFTALGLDIELVADYVGKPVGQVTQTDVDFVADILAQQELLADPTTFVPTDQQLQYDVNNDGVIDINDQAMLEQSFAGQDIALQGQFAPTGLYEVNQQTQQDLQTAQDLNTQQNLNIQNQIEATRQRGNQEEFLRALAADPGRSASTQQMGTANIDYLYDIGGGSIFAPTNRTNLFTPYGGSNVVPVNPNPQQRQPRAAAQGGLLSRNDELLKLLGEY